MYAYPGGYPEGTDRVPGGPRSLHFRRRRPIPRLPELASNSARPAAALRDVEVLDEALRIVHNPNVARGVLLPHRENLWHERLFQNALNSHNVALRLFFLGCRFLYAEHVKEVPKPLPASPLIKEQGCDL